MKNILVLLIALLVVSPALCQSKKKQKQADSQTASWRYEVEQTSVANQGTCILKVWSYSKDPRVATEQSKKNAVHAVIFKGVPDRERMKGFRPLVTDLQKVDQMQTFFNDFFAQGGDYMRYVSNTTTGMIDAGDVVKISKNEYKVGVTVTVLYDELRRRLEAEGAVKKLSSGF